MIKLYPHNPQWLLSFEEVASFLRTAVKGSEVHHIGSTSVPGLVSKEDLDILMITPRLKDSLLLQQEGYLFKGELNIPLRYFFSKNNDKIKINLHVVEKDHPFIHLNLCFRDYLRSHEDARESYGKLKMDLLKDPLSHQKQNSGFPRYSLEKNEFIKKTLQEAGYEGFSLNFCLHHQEKEAYERLTGFALPSEGFNFVFYKGVEIVAAAYVSKEGRLQMEGQFLDSLAVYLNRWTAFHESP